MVDETNRYATIGKTFRLEAAHVLPHHEGKCARLHGHSYKVEVRCSGPIKGATGESDEGMVLDFAELKAVWSVMHDRLDHQLLNDVLPADFLPSTAENLARYAFAEFAAADLPVIAVRVWETATSWAEVGVA